jgi:hypothetical protein
VRHPAFLDQVALHPDLGRHCFRDVDTPNRLWPVTARVDARGRDSEVSLRFSSYAATVIPSTPALASRFCRRNARSSAAIST